MDFLYFCMAFISGILFNSFFGYMIGLGWGAIVFRSSMTDCLLLISKNVQTVFEINHLKYLAMEMMDRDEKYIEFQKRINDREIASLKNTLIRNHINAIPPRFNSLVKFHDWDSAMDYLDNTLKEIGGKSD